MLENPVVACIVVVIALTCFGLFFKMAFDSRKEEDYQKDPIQRIREEKANMHPLGIRSDGGNYPTKNLQNRQN